MSQKRSRASSAASGEGSGSSHHSPYVGTSTPKGPLVYPSQDLDEFQDSFWKYQMELVEAGGDGEGNLVDLKSGTPTGGQLPLARIKKVMKSDDHVKMISAEAPILFARACEIFISDLTCRAFLIAEEHKRRTIQRSDIAGAIGRSDLFDFLIDVVPRHESLPSSRLPGNRAVKVERTAEGQNASRAKAAARARAERANEYRQSTGAAHEMASWLNDTAGQQPSSTEHLDYAAAAVPHAWQQGFPDLCSHSANDDRGGLDSLF